MKTTQTTIIVLVAFLFHFSTYAQERYDVKLINDTVYNHDVPQFICKFRSGKKADMYSLRSLDNKTEALLICVPDSNRIRFSGSFTVLNVRYSCFYPTMEISTLLDSYVRNKVFVNGKANLEGLQAYCKERGLALATPPVRKVPNPLTRDSILAANARVDAANQVKFTFHNNASKPVRVFIGDKPKGGSGRIQIIQAHGDFAEHARKTEKVFLLNESGETLQSLSITDSLKRVVIKPTADGFE